MKNLTKQEDIRKYNEPVKENKINFSHNWNNKLDCKFFTTIRAVDKSTFYELRLKERFNVYLNEKLYCQALLHDVSVLNFKDVTTPEIFVIDTGTLSYREVFDKFGINGDFILLLFERLK